jgi:hypothetical protein
MKTLTLLMLAAACAVASEKAPTGPVASDTQPGTVRWVKFTPPDGWESAKLLCRDKEIKHAAAPGKERFAYVAESYFSMTGEHFCWLQKGEDRKDILALTVKPKKFPSERLNVDFRKVKLSPKDQARASKEQVLLNLLYQRSAPLPYFSVPFKAPLSSTITSIYGSQRVYNKKHRSQHLGTDFRAAIGVPVPAANRGRVMFAGDLFYTGGTVIIDHGMDIFTVYGHLSEVKTQEGQIVNQDDVIGLTGNTGRSSGPHLHWGVKIHGDYVDGYSLIEQTRLQFP